VPIPALALGLVGALPFVAGAIAMYVGPDWLKLTAYLHLMNYAALILAFIGAVHWGLALAADDRIDAGWRWYLVSVTPALLGWIALGLIQPLGKLALFAIAYVGVFMVDTRAARAGLAPAWYPKLRKPLTIIVLLSIAAVGFAVR
jgi:hypothetical protein